MTPIFALVDCNNFYASCERVFNPILEGKPVIVLSNNDGCIVARSNEAKAIGIKMGVPFYEIKNLINTHNIQVFSSNYTLYGDMSQRVMESLKEFTPEIEMYSIDEAFLNLTGFEHLDLTEYGRKIKKSIKQWTGIPVSVGIARTKTLAKLANRIAKKNPEKQGVANLLDPKDEIEALSKIAVEDVWGIGSSSAKLLQSRGIRTALDLRNADDRWIKKKMGIVGLRTVMELRGISCLPLEDCRPTRKGMMISRMFGKPIETLTELKEAMAMYLSRAAEKLRNENLAANVLSIYVMTDRFKEPYYSRVTTIELPVATNDTQELLYQGLRAVEALYRKGLQFKKGGVMVSDLVDADHVQQNLFDSEDRDRSKRLMQAMDQVNSTMGAETLRFAVAGINRNWKVMANHKSKRYTTSWDELANAKA
jgi:DNA polymerase V